MSSGREKEAADENRIEDVRAALSHKKISCARVPKLNASLVILFTLGGHKNEWPLKIQLCARMSTLHR